jgi:cobalt-zinc-cadmium efflux system membrane fusion protein
MTRLLPSFVLLLALAFLAGCSQPAPQPNPPAGHAHDGYWCNEHGVPEEVCALCNPKIAGEFQKKGDWCEKHERPDSQCFLCHPEKEAEFAAAYEVKFGQKPPKPAM